MALNTELTGYQRVDRHPKFKFILPSTPPTVTTWIDARLVKLILSVHVGAIASASLKFANLVSTAQREEEKIPTQNSAV